ncbi:hypothetical protein ACFV5N_09240 [Streptomyces sp. NPDC059853]|uniref:hypothetical protein n=1 Tax=Streptomyces TaxID=1883 RepID=UPI00366230B2
MSTETRSVVSILGGKVHAAAMTVIPWPLCRTGASTLLSVPYRHASAPIDCDDCTEHESH